MTRIAMDPGRRETIRAMAEPQLIHGAIEAAYAGDRERRLWRIDWIGEKCWLLIVSREKPLLQEIQLQFGLMDPAYAGDAKDYQPFLDRLSKGQYWRFRLRANPVVSVAAKELGVRGKVLAHVTQEQQKQWLTKRASDHGFSLESDDFDVVHTAWHRFSKGGRQPVTIRTATYEGFLRVEDADLLRAGLAQGIGRARAYGCGLLTLMHPGEKHGG